MYFVDRDDTPTFRLGWHTRNIASCLTSLCRCSQIAWEYIYTYPFPIVAKTLAVGTANGTAVNTFYLRSDHLATSNDTSVVAPNHDTIYSQAWLDLSQVRTRHVLRMCLAVAAVGCRSSSVKGSTTVYWNSCYQPLLR